MLHPRCARGEKRPDAAQTAAQATSAGEKWGPGGPIEWRRRLPDLGYRIWQVAQLHKSEVGGAQAQLDNMPASIILVMVWRSDASAIEHHPAQTVFLHGHLLCRCRSVHGERLEVEEIWHVGRGSKWDKRISFSWNFCSDVKNWFRVQIRSGLISLECQFQGFEDQGLI
jgi:hypothetical protein